MTIAALIIGASSGIGTALIRRLLKSDGVDKVISVSRAESVLDTDATYTDKDKDYSHIQSTYSESDIQTIAAEICKNHVLTLIVICNGKLHNEDSQSISNTLFVDQSADRQKPEKRIEDLSASWALESFSINALLPMLWISALTPHLMKQEKSHTVKMVVFSARIGSIGDNQLGGWYSYRASKAALNMFLKTAAIELARRAPQVKLISFHPGTTDTRLSKPFQGGVAEDRLFTTDFVAGQLLTICKHSKVDGQLSFLDWNNKPIIW